MPIDTLLHKASHNGDIKQVQALLEIGEIKIDAPGASERRPLHRAAGANHLEVCKYLISKGATVDQTDKSKRTPLHWACTSGHTKSASFLIDNGADLLACNSSNMTPLHMSAENGRAETVSMLIEKAMDKNIDLYSPLNDDGKTAWAVAKECQQQNVAKVLKDNGDPNAKSACCTIS